MRLKNSYKHLRLILGDQLNENHSWFKDINDKVLYVILELKQEQEYVKHHIQKVGAFFLAMRSFGKLLKKNGHHILYISITHEQANHSFNANIKALIKQFSIQQFDYQQPDEYRLQEELKELCLSIVIDSKLYDTEHFYTSQNELAIFFEGKKLFILESFYKNLRKKHHILVDNKLQPEGGKWNYDKENRNKIPKNHQIYHLKTLRNNVEQINKELEEQHIETFGTIKNIIEWPVTREQSLETLNDFLTNGLPFFGMFQDAMTLKSWRVYHSLLSFSLNVKLISPKEVIDQALAKYQSSDKKITLPQIEGFVRQILGWREYVRGIYWMKMPNYNKENYFELNRALPSYYWDGNTKMTCVKHSTKQSLDYSYAHHIQRLMVLGNFALLNGTNPKEVDNWYLGVYADAIEWVQLPNTRGMSQFADGGTVGTKPYVSSANYINKMGDYCSNCSYNYKKASGENACPFNSLYWNFIDQHKGKLQNNRRMSMMYALWNKKANEEKVNILKQAKTYLEQINNL